MKRFIWNIIFVSEVLLIGGLASLPNRFYNEPTSIAQYAGYARGFSPLIPVTTLGFLGFDLCRANKKRKIAKKYCSICFLKSFESIPLHRFLDVSGKDLEKAITEYHLLQEQGIPCDNHVVKILRGFSDEG
jgi:hypothetical protein